MGEARVVAGYSVPGKCFVVFRRRIALKLPVSCGRTGPGLRLYLFIVVGELSSSESTSARKIYKLIVPHFFSIFSLHRTKWTFAFPIYFYYEF